MSGSKTSSLQDKEFQIGDVKVTISAAWVRRINSPLMYVISALTGVSVTFMPVNPFLARASPSWLQEPLGVAMLCNHLVGPWFLYGSRWPRAPSGPRENASEQTDQIGLVR